MESQTAPQQRANAATGPNHQALKRSDTVTDSNDIAAPAGHGTRDGENTPPLGTGWTIATFTIGVFAALIALGGMVLSFRAVSTEMIPAFGAWSFLVPIVVDLTVLVFSGVDLVITRRGYPHPLARATVYGATAGTVWLNYAAGGNLVGRIAHILMPSIWVMFIELMRHVVRHEANLTGTLLRQPIPATRWILSPLPTALLFRRMVLWQIHSYPAALAHERERLRAIAKLREKHGWLLWRFYVTPLERLNLSLGPAATDNPPTVNPSPATVNTPPAEDTDNPARTVNGNTAATVKRPSTPTVKPRPDRQPATVNTPAATGPTPTTERWVEIGKPVYLAVKDATGKRPSEGAYTEALAAEVARLIASGELPDTYADPSPSTAKRIRGEIEARFPELAPLRIVPSLALEATG